MVDDGLCVGAVLLIFCLLVFKYILTSLRLPRKSSSAQKMDHHPLTLLLKTTLCVILGTHLLPTTTFCGLFFHPPSYATSNSSNKTIITNLICALAHCLPGHANFPNVHNGSSFSTDVKRCLSSYLPRPVSFRKSEKRLGMKVSGEG